MHWVLPLGGPAQREAAPAGVAYLAFGDYAWSESDNGHDIALHQRKFVNGLRTDGCADIAGLGFQDGGFFGDLDLDGDAQERKVEIEDSGLIDFEANLFLDFLLEACGCDRNLVKTGRQNRNRVDSSGVCS